MWDCWNCIFFILKSFKCWICYLFQVAANGDTANKIGTYQIAIIAKHHNVPFYVAAPLTSIDMSLKCGDSIKIEERPDKEMTHIGDFRIAAPGNISWFYIYN